MNIKISVPDDREENSLLKKASYILAFLAEIGGGIFAVCLYIRFLLTGGYGGGQDSENELNHILIMIMALVYILGFTFYCMNRYRIARIIRVIIDLVCGILLGFAFGGAMMLVAIDNSPNAITYYNKFTGVAFAILFELSALALFITYVKNNEGLKKILMSVSMVVIIMLCQVFSFFENIYNLCRNNLYEQVHDNMDNYEKYVESEEIILHVFKQVFLIGGIAFAICLIIALILLFYDSCTRRYIRHLLFALANTILVIPFVLAMVESVSTIIVLVIIVLDILGCGFLRRCPSCGKLFALRGLGLEWISNEDINIKVENKIRDSYGAVIATKEQRVAGIKENYDVIFQCRYCEHLKRKREEERREKT